jgi:alkylation response protein AidB-like acyl-CoA dehydrogenase
MGGDCNSNSNNSNNKSRRNTTTTALRSITTYSQLPEEHKMVHEMCRKLADEEIAPHAKKWDQQHSFPTAAITKLVR